MKIILSRKGFDSGAGGCASPIFEDDTLLSLPIPDGRSKIKYRDLQSPICEVGSLVEDLSGCKVMGHYPAHLDPDLEHGSLPQRHEGWRPSLGQTGSSQTHLETNGINQGDIFLFFGWFRDVHVSDGGRWKYTPKGRNVHAFFGWNQVDDVLSLRNGTEDEWASYSWLVTHPHVRRGAELKNTIYVGANELVLPGIGRTGLRGGGTVRKLSEVNTLTSSSAKSRSQWRLPLWMAPKGESVLSYHSSPERWVIGDEHCLLSAVARGQEFVLDCKDRPEVSDWILNLLA